MKKLLLIGTAVAALSAPTLAQDDKHFDGGYVGVETGVMDSEFYYGALAGFRKQADNNWVYGLEGTYGAYDNDSNTSINEYGLSGVFGKAYGKSLFFGTIGVNVLDFSANFSGYSLSTSDTGFKGGLGYEYKLSKSLSLRIKGEYVNHGSNADDVKATAGLSFNF